MSNGWCHEIGKVTRVVWKGLAHARNQRDHWPLIILEIVGRSKEIDQWTRKGEEQSIYFTSPIEWWRL